MLLSRFLLRLTTTRTTPKRGLSWSVVSEIHQSDFRQHASPQRPWIEHAKGSWPQVHDEAFVHPLACLIGQVSIDADCSIWPHAVLRADGGRIQIGKGSNIQDGTVVHLTENLSHTLVGEY